ncbi:hypothetical protein C2G38_2186582 [Gigaspora rosea]|uniref:Uncharacterized protein n=1 Tax=Gigaspora rosea TaxID=44941 RepID=A0A397V8R0_9GLOM|nr:hypothetical protein C2G38_2186582 [Gigaspora rosea]
MSLERNKYPENNQFSLKQNNTKYTYNIINEGYYPSNNILRYTSSHNTSSSKTQYKIPDGYLVETSWGRGKSRHIVECEIEYNPEGPVFRVRFNESSQQLVIESNESSSKVANEYLQKKGSINCARISRIHVFGLNAMDVEQERERKKKEKRLRFLKPFSMLSESMKTKRSRAFSLHLGKTFENESFKFYNPNDQPILQEICFNIQDKNYLVNYCKEKEDQYINAFVKVIDQNLISRDAYRELSALEPDLPREHNISDAKKRINKEMNEKILIFILDIKNVSITATNEVSHIDDEEVEKEMLKYVGKAGYRKITDILLFIIPGLVEQNVLNINNPVIHIRISGDGCNVGRKIKHVMVTCTLLDDILNINKAEFHYTIILYPSNENYEILQNVMEPMINKLHNLVTNGLDSSGTRWTIIPYFSNDWKFLKKTMEQLQTTKPPPGHSKAPLLYMIPLEHYVPDLLHIMLRIWDRMWSLVIQELKSENRYDDNIRAIIHSEMQRISVKFHFWQDHDTQNWNNTPLMGDDKETVLCNFNFELIFNKEWGMQINPKSWLDLFLTPSQGEPNTRDFKRGLYQPKNVTPYIHVLVHNVYEFMESHRRKTIKNGGNGEERKSAIFEILCYENRSIYFTQNPTTTLVFRPQRLYIKSD